VVGVSRGNRRHVFTSGARDLLTPGAPWLALVRWTRRAAFRWRKPRYQRWWRRRCESEAFGPMGVRGVFVRLAGRGRCIQPIGCAAAGATVVESSSWMGNEPSPGLPGVGEGPVPGFGMISPSCL
jgi:hypothetical protein